MNCQKCQDLLSEYLDGTLKGDARALLGKHLVECAACEGVRRDLETITGVARQSHQLLYAPPNARALWLRIQNTIEAERAAEEKAAAARRASVASGGFWTRLMGKRWELSLPQLAVSVAALALVVSVGTSFGLRGLRDAEFGANGGARTRSSAPASGFGSHVDAATDALYHQSYLQQQEARISYWSRRVEQRKASWNPQMRDAFDRSVAVYDDTISEALGALERDPHDDVSQEVLNATLREKMEFLREFSDQ